MSSAVGRASFALASGTVLSRILGFVNISVLAAVIGLTGTGPDAFALANQLPTYIYSIVAGGLLSAVLVPHIVAAATQADGGQAFVNRLVTLGVSVFLIAAALATLAAPGIVTLYALAGGTGSLANGGLELAIALAFWCLPQILFYAVYALVGEVLSARGIFGPAAWAPALNNVVMIGVLVLFGVLYGFGGHESPADWTPDRIALLGGGATLGVVAQAVLLLFFWRRTGLRFRPDFRWRGAGLGAPARAAGWVFGMVLVVQLTNFVQTNVAATTDTSDASLAVLRVAWLIFMLSHSIVAISIATPYFTRMATAVRDADLPALRTDLSAALRTIALLVTAAGVALAAAAVPFAAFFEQESARSIGLVLVAFLVGLVPFSTLYVVLRAFYALGDTRTPFLLQVLQAALFIAATLAVLAVPSEWRAVGIGLATSVSGAVQAVAAALLLRRRLGGGGRGIARRFGVYALASIPAAAAGLGVLGLLGGFAPDGFATEGPLEGLLATALIGLASILVFFLVLLATRAPELNILRTLLRRTRSATAPK